MYTSRHYLKCGRPAGGGTAGFKVNMYLEYLKKTVCFRDKIITKEHYGTRKHAYTIYRMVQHSVTLSTVW